MSIYFRKPGLLTTVQDLGRRGHRRLGINPGGAMDRAASRVAAVLAGLADDAPTLEMHFPAPEIVFEQATRIAIAGAEFGATLEGVPFGAYRSGFAPAGSVLRFTGRVSGARCYLAVGAGLDVESWLGSSSTNTRAGVGGPRGGGLPIAARDRIAFTGDASAVLPALKGRSASFSLRPRYADFPTVRAVAGAEFSMLDDTSRDFFRHATFVVGNDSDRMGFRLDGARLTLREPVEMVSSAVDFGTVQLSPDGRPTILMADHQTAGGYPRIAHVIPTDLPLVAQLGARDRIAFHFVGIGVAEAAMAVWENDLRLLKTAVAFRLR